jgi:glucosylceramidase
MKHYTHAVRRGAKRFDSQGELEGLAHVAFVNPDGTKSMVLSNVGGARTVQLRLGDMMTEVSLPGDSLTNLSWT